MNEEGFQKTEYALWGGIVVLTVLACLKGVVGFQAQSNSLLAAAAQSAAGVCVLVAAIMRVRKTRVQLAGASFRGLDKKSAVGSLLFIVLIMVIGVELGIISVKSLINDVEYEPKMISLAVLIISLITKEIMFQYLSRLGKKVGTEEFIANARRRRSDIYSSFVVVIGILSMMLAHAFGYYRTFLCRPSCGTDRCTFYM